MTIPWLFYKVNKTYLVNGITQDTHWLFYNKKKLADGQKFSNSGGSNAGTKWLLAATAQGLGELAKSSYLVHLFEEQLRYIAILKKKASKVVASEILPAQRATPELQQELQELNKWLRI